MLSIEMILVRWIPSFIQFWVSIPGIPRMAMVKAIESNRRLCPSFDEAKDSHWQCIDVFSRSSKVLAAVLGLEGTLATTLILSSDPSYRMTVFFTMVTLAGIYAFYLFEYARDRRHIGVFTRLTKRKIIRRLSKKITHNDFSSVIALVAGLVAALLAEILIAH